MQMQKTMQMNEMATVKVGLNKSSLVSLGYIIR